MSEEAVTFDAPFDAGDPVQVSQARGRVKRREKQRREDLAQVLETPGGRRVIWALLGDCGVFGLSYVQGDSHHTAFNEGRRQVGNPLLAEIVGRHADAYALMAKEAQEDGANDTA